MSSGRESAYATGSQISMSRRAAQQSGVGSGTQAMHMQPVTVQAAADEVASQHGAAVQPVPSSQTAHVAHSHHSSTATLVYAPGQGSISGRKRPFEGSADAEANDRMKQLSHRNSEDCSPHAKTRRASLA